MEQKLESIASRKGYFYTRDIPGINYDYHSETSASGKDKYFTGQRGGKRPKVMPFPPPLNPVYIKELTYKSENFESSITAPNWGTRWYYGDLGAVVAGAISILNELEPHHEIDIHGRDMALQKAYANIESSDFNSQMFLAELGETISMLKNPLAGIKKIHGKYQKGRKRISDLIKSGTKASADVYLQTMFGVMPLINDVQSIYEASIKAARLENQLYGKGSVKFNYKKCNYFPLFNKFGFHTLQAQTCATSATKITSKVYYRLQWSNAMYDLIRKWGFNPINLPITAWETVPLSFVVDWFLGVKLWLQAMAPKPGVEILGNYVSEKLIEDLSITYLQTFISPNYTTPKTWYMYDPWSMHSERLIRQVNLPVPSYPLTGFGLDSLGKQVSLAMLSVQKIKF